MNRKVWGIAIAPTDSHCYNYCLISRCSFSLLLQVQYSCLTQTDLLCQSFRILFGRLFEILHFAHTALLTHSWLFLLCHQESSRMSCKAYHLKQLMEDLTQEMRPCISLD